MCFIITCHFLQYYDNELAWWFNVGVQIFFIMSGFLYGRKEINDPITFFKRQFKKILIPYYTFLIPVSIIYLFFAGDSITIASFIKSMFCAGTIEGLGHLWFVGYILFCYTITPYLFWIKKQIENYSMTKMTVVSLGCLGLAVILSTLFHSYFDASRICCYIVGYFIAMYYGRCGDKIIKVFAFLFSVIAIPANLLRIYLKYIYRFPENSVFERLFIFSEGYMHLALGAMIFLILFIALKETKPCTLVEKSDKYSYYIYVVHQLFIFSPFSLMTITPLKVLNWGIACMCIFVTAYIVYIFSEIITKTIAKRST